MSDKGGSIRLGVYMKPTNDGLEAQEDLKANKLVADPAALSTNLSELLQGTAYRRGSSGEPEAPLISNKRLSEFLFRSEALSCREDPTSSAEIDADPESYRHRQLDQFIVTHFADVAGYRLESLMGIKEPKPVKLSHHELLAVAFRGASGFEEDHQWSTCLFSHRDYRPLATVLNTLELRSPLDYVRDLSLKSIFMYSHPDLVRLFTTAAVHDASPFRVEKMITSANRRFGAEAANKVADAAISSNSVLSVKHKESIRALLARLGNFGEARQSVGLTESEKMPIPPVGYKLSTLIFEAAHAPDENSFNQLVDRVINEYPTLAAAALAPLANTFEPTLRSWTLAAFNTVPQLREYSALLLALPVSCRDSG